MADQTVTRGSFECSDSPVLHYAEQTPLERRKERDRIRTACQAPISQSKKRVMYLVNGRERRSPWFYRDETTHRAFKLMQAKYGERNCIIYVD